MLVLTVEVDTDDSVSLAVKEVIAMAVEKYGYTRVTDIKVVDGTRVQRYTPMRPPGRKPGR